jgi:BirA family biotin operon repressor/biotin-[acetyl-CoA-carboxylase] ligase
MAHELTTLFTGRRLLDVESVGSTNFFLAEWLRRETLPEGTVVRAAAQPEGRGQQGTRWHSSPGKNLLVSYYFRPDFLPLPDVFRLNEAFSLAVADTVAAFVPQEVRIKWPNDIYVNGEKIAGLLIENSIAGNRISSCILGVGLNVNETAFPPGIPNPVSLALLLRHPASLDEVWCELCNRLEQRYLQLKAGKSGALHDEFLERQFLRGAWAWYGDAGGHFRARLTGVTLQGRLVLERENGEERSYDLKEVRYATGI